MKKVNSFVFCRISALLMGMLAIILVTGTLTTAAMETAEYEEDPNYIPPPVITEGDYGYQVNEDETIVIVEYTGDDDVIVIPSEIDGFTVTMIGKDAFEYKKMKSVMIPDSVRRIGQEAFEYSEITESLRLPQNVEIWSGAFAYAKLPTIVNIPAGAIVEDSAFSYCDRLQQVFIGEGAVLKNSAIGYCDELNTVVCAGGSVLESEAVEYCDALGQVILCDDAQLSETAFSSCGEIEYIEAEEIVFQPQSEPEPAPAPEVPELSWEEYAAGQTEQELGGRFVQFPVQGIELFLLNTYEPRKLGSEYDAFNYIGYYTPDENSLIPGIAVQYTSQFHLDTFEKYCDFVKNLGSMIEILGELKCNGLECLLYQMPDSHTIVIGTLCDNGVLEVAVKADDEASLEELAGITAVSIREIRE